VQASRGLERADPTTGNSHLTSFEADLRALVPAMTTRAGADGQHSHTRWTPASFQSCLRGS